MNERALIGTAAIAALVCAAALSQLMSQLSRTRLSLAQDGVIAFNYIQQNDHNFDEFAHELRAWQQARRVDPDASRRGVLDRFDILWSALAVGDVRWSGVLEGLPETDRLHAEMRAFVERGEPLLRPRSVLSDESVNRLAEEARALGRRVYEIGLDMYVRKSQRRDDIAVRMEHLTRAFWVTGAASMLAFAALATLLTRAYRRASTLLEQSGEARRELATALEELSSGDVERRRQNRFIATASHDLRQPLHALGLYLTTLRGHVSTPLGRRILDNAMRSTEALNQMLSSVLDISRLDAEVVDVNRTDVPLDAVFDTLYRTFLPEATERDLSFEIAEVPFTVHTDRVLLERILANLVSNAIRHTERGGIGVGAERDGDTILVRVTDTGRGIPARERDAVFDEYYQIELPGDDAGRGLGLGLSIVRRLTRLLELELEVESHVGVGTRFALRLPAGDARAPGTAPAGEVPARFDGVHFDGLTVLVIDDDRDVRDGMHRLLEQRSCRVMAVESAREARAAIVAEEAIPDVVVADYRLRDGLTGAHAIEEVREEVNEDVPAVIVTADTSPARLREARASGFRLLHKPVEPEELFDVIGELAGRKE